jgi:hypothetical protein
MALVFCAATLLASPSLANSLHDEGDFGGGFAIIGPSGGPERDDYLQKHTFRPYYGPAYSYDDLYDDVPEYYDAPGVVVLPDAPVGY